VLEIDTIEGCITWTASGSDRAAAAFKAIDLRNVAGFESGSFDGCLFLSCQLTPAQAGFLTISGGTVIRDGDGRPYTAHRAQLYEVDELFAGFDPDNDAGYEATVDAQIYRHWTDTGRQYPPSISESLARRLHDHSISGALYAELDGQRPVAIMGGHGVERSEPLFSSIGRISRALARDGFLMLSGGGPGAMEATHFGAWMAHFGDEDFSDAVDMLSPRPSEGEPGKEYADADWLHRAFEVRQRWPIESPTYTSIGIPTWMYGHEPPSAFATRIAKYFANSVREEGLLAVATHGVVFAPGSAGTIQEIFQDAAQNHYASFGPASPMVLLGIDYWTSHRPVWPLLESLADGYGYRNLITLTDDEDEAIETIRNYQRDPES
jgi:predicted Rossmann-fold nucleotide-binding protein